jgi:hypothetical protein
MASVRFLDVQARPTEFLDFTSLTLDEFQQLLPPFEAAFQAHMATWCLDGKPRTARQFAVYKNCPLPTPEDRLFFILVVLENSNVAQLASIPYHAVHALPVTLQIKPHRFLHLISHTNSLCHAPHIIPT